MAELIPGLSSATGDLMNAIVNVDGSLRTAAFSAQVSLLPPPSGLSLICSQHLDSSIANSTSLVDRMNNDLTSMQAHIDEAKSFFKWVISIKDSLPSSENMTKAGRILMYLCYVVFINIFIGILSFREVRANATASNGTCYATALIIAAGKWDSSTSFDIHTNYLQSLPA